MTGVGWALSPHASLLKLFIILWKSCKLLWTCIKNVSCESYLLICWHAVNDSETMMFLIFFFFFFDSFIFTRRLPTMVLHEQTSFISVCLLHIPLFVIHRFLFDTDLLWHCLSIFSSVFPGFLYPILMFPLLLLIVWSHPSAFHAQNISYWKKTKKNRFLTTAQL